MPSATAYVRPGAAGVISNAVGRERQSGAGRSCRGVPAVDAPRLPGDEAGARAREEEERPARRRRARPSGRIGVRSRYGRSSAATPRMPARHGGRDQPRARPRSRGSRPRPSDREVLRHLHDARLGGAVARHRRHGHERRHAGDVHDRGAAVERARGEERLACDRHPKRRRQVDAQRVLEDGRGPTRSAGARSSRRRCSRARRARRAPPPARRSPQRRGRRAVDRRTRPRSCS